MAQKNVDGRVEIGTGSGDNGGPVVHEPQVDPPGLGEHGVQGGGGWVDNPMPEGPSYGVNAHRPSRDKTGP